MSFFGTDGIRGRAGEGKLSDANITRMARAIGAHVGPGGSVVIGRDTRVSGPHIQSLLETGIAGQGVSIIRLGVLPTPATALLTERHGADLGIMITASHNPWHDNGVKIFNADGRKLSDQAQTSLETLIQSDIEPSGKRGDMKDDPGASQRYVDHLMESAGHADLSGLRIVTDGANGAGHALLPDLLRTLGADVIAIGSLGDGNAINRNCGSTKPETCRQAVLDNGADVGFALDGDADRILAIDDQGRDIDGDQIIARLALDACAEGTLKGDAIVSTVMANIALEGWADTNGLRLERTAVGDRHVAARMKEIGANIGGEPSGHILLTDLAKTGDGCLTALRLAVSLARSGERSADWLQMFKPAPQVLRNVRYAGRSPLDKAPVTVAIETQQSRLAGSGRVLVRASGTEPVIRVMAEGDDLATVTDAVDKISAVIADTAQS